MATSAAAPGLEWEREGRRWPHRAASRFVNAAGLRWHAQLMRCTDAAAAADAPLALLLHGTGASTHSWRGLLPLLAARCHVLAFDLPGHGFTGMPAVGAFSRQFSPRGMAAAVAAAVAAVDLASQADGGAPLPPPALVIGHSAGAAVALHGCLDGHFAPQAVVSLNGALLPLAGIAGRLLPPAAKLAAVLPFMPNLFAWRAGDRAVLQQLLAGTGSVLDAEGTALYATLAGNAGHVAGALAMMANWDLRPLARELPRLRVPLALLVGEADGTVPPEQARQVQRLLPAATLIGFDGLGHLAHEEQPQRVADALWSVFNAHRAGQKKPSSALP